VILRQGKSILPCSLYHLNRVGVNNVKSLGVLDYFLCMKNIGENKIVFAKAFLKMKSLQRQLYLFLLV
jgi:hypothetical protein